MLKESLSERAKRTGFVLTGIKIEGGKIFKNGVEVSKETAALFIQTGTTAKEFLTQRKEQIIVWDSLLVLFLFQYQQNLQEL